MYRAISAKGRDDLDLEFSDVVPPRGEGPGSNRSGDASSGDRDPRNPTSSSDRPSASRSVHAPVLVEEVVSFLDLSPGAIVVDATVGAVGHALHVLPRITPGGRLVGIDRDPQILDVARERLQHFGDSVRLVHARADEIDIVLAREGLKVVDAVLFDLGVSSLQIDRAERGFSFEQDGPLDMRMDPRLRRTAADFVNSEPEDSLARALRDYGDERFANRIARAIVRERVRRPFRRTLELADLVARTVPAPRPARGRKGLHPATRTFQAIRIAVNDELGALEQALPKALEALRPGGRLAVISFHSLEDRIVKQFIREESRRGRMDILTKKPLGPSAGEIASNPRSRSAKLRVAKRAVESDADGHRRGGRG
ncbi:MAG: 16S rRNA (cytosine(1402)-N(4))-methyltransferase RsmH [Planctomycetes bacterium]|nr:16S rRNA (cytosine(1402)-N(4))-methyltransferase RsmH [Planctomycetota bacterium]